MKKKVRSFNISDEAFRVIDEYKIKNRLGSNSTALEKILLDSCEKKEDLKQLVEEIMFENGYIEKEKHKVEEENIIDEVSAASLNSMNEILKEIGLS